MSPPPTHDNPDSQDPSGPDEHDQARISLRVAVILSLSIACGLIVGVLTYLALGPDSESQYSLIASSVLAGAGVVAGAFLFFDRVIH